MSTDAERWTCGRCEVSVGRIDGEMSGLPETWSAAEESVYCLSCSRARASEAAAESAPEATSREDLVRLRRTALIEFEIGRVPAAPDRTIANSCRTSSGAVAAVRGDLDRAAAEPVAPGIGA